MMNKSILIVALALVGCAPSNFYTVDGDTVNIGSLRVRLATHDAPELFHPRCERELVLARKAKDRLKSLLTGDYSIEYVACATGTGARDKYGRACAVFRVPPNGEDVGDILIREGLAVRYGNGKPDWCRS
jgi:endonuclease YncB( thermonuclease family)